jgi:uncharacterized lipoprotein YbaY
MKLWLPIGFFALVTIPWLSAPTASAADLTQQAEQVVQHLEGILSTAQRAAANPKVANVTMRTCRVQVANPPAGSIYLYQEQAIHDKLTKPYRQRILEISPSPASQTIRSRSSKLADQAKWVNFCDRADRQIQREDFPTVVCAVFLKPTPEGFSGTTEATGCPANVRGAVMIRNRIRLHPNGMDTWDRGFDAQGKQVWGAGDEPYQFLRPTGNLPLENP